MSDAFTAVLSDEIKRASQRSGAEWVIPIEHLKQALQTASDNGIAVLGIEILKLLDDGSGAKSYSFAVEGYSGYEIKYSADWVGFVRDNNERAKSYVDANPFGKGYGYILTSASSKEFQDLKVSNG